MTSTLSRVVLALGLVAVVGGAPTYVGAQSEAESSETESSEAESSEGEATDSSDKKASDGGQKGADDSEADDSSKQAKNEESDSADETESGGQSDSEGEADGQKQAAETGPGGKKLRDDYPGKEEARQKKMDTKRIEGLQFKEGDDPSDAYNLEIRELETKIDDLKEKVFQSKSRVVLLKETVLGGNLSGSRAVIVHTDELGGRFKLQRAMYSLDGNRVFNESRKTGNLPKKKKFKVYDDSLTTGQHNVSILLEYQGSGFGIFNYMQGYKFKITSSCQFTAKAGKLATLKIKSINKAGALKDVEKQPGIQCELTHTDLSQSDLEASSDGGSNESKQGGAKGAGGAASSSGASSE